MLKRRLSILSVPLLVLLLMGVVLPAGADIGRVDDETDEVEREIAERVRLRKFPGGADEEDLLVQKPLPLVSRKMSPAAEAERAEAEVSED